MFDIPTHRGRQFLTVSLESKCWFLYSGVGEVGGGLKGCPVFFDAITAKTAFPDVLWVGLIGDLT